MAATDLVTQLLNELSAGHSIRWQEAREQIHDEHSAATSTEDRITLLELHRALMDAVERNCVEPDKLAEFRKARLQDYRLLLFKEAVIGRTDGMVDPVSMGRIAQREAEAGRLSTDDELYTLGVGGSVFISGIDPTGKLIRLPTAFEKRSALVCRTLVLAAASWIVLRKGWPTQILAHRLVDLTLGQLIGAIIEMVFAVAVTGWLFYRLLNPPPEPRRTKDWCDGWTWAGTMPFVLVGAAFLVLKFPPQPPMLANLAARFLTDFFSLFI